MSPKLVSPQYKMDPVGGRGRYVPSVCQIGFCVLESNWQACKRFPLSLLQVGKGRNTNRNGSESILAYLSLSYGLRCFSSYKLPVLSSQWPKS